MVRQIDGWKEKNERSRLRTSHVVCLAQSKATSPAWPASITAAQPADWPRRPEAKGSLEHDLALKEASELNIGGGERVARVARVRQLGQLRRTEPRVEVVDGRGDAAAQQPRLLGCVEEPLALDHPVREVRREPQARHPSEQPRRGEGAAQVAPELGRVCHGWQRTPEARVARLREGRRPGLVRARGPNRPARACHALGVRAGLRSSAWAQGKGFHRPMAF